MSDNQPNQPEPQVIEINGHEVELNHDGVKVNGKPLDTMEAYAVGAVASVFSETNSQALAAFQNLRIEALQYLEQEEEEEDDETDN